MEQLDTIMLYQVHYHETVLVEAVRYNNVRQGVVAIPQLLVKQLDTITNVGPGIVAMT